MIQETVFTQDQSGTRTALLLSKQLNYQTGYGQGGSDSGGAPSSDASKATQPDIKLGKPEIEQVDT